MEKLLNLSFILVVLTASVVWLYAFYKRSRFFIYILQLEGYKTENYSKWLEKSKGKVFSKKVVLPIIFSIILFIITILIDYKGIYMIYILIWILLIIKSIEKPKLRKDLVVTARVKRLFLFLFLVSALDITIFTLFVNFLLRNDLYLILILLLTLNYLFVPYTVLLANFTVMPIEKIIYKYYFNKAKNKIKEMKNLKVIGIAGSYGKTSTKFITSTILKEKFKVLHTPGSFNTPMGISKIINNELTDDYEIFIAEMGAKRRGEIKEICELVNHQIGILTPIGPTHLDTHKTIENVIKTEYEVIENLYKNGLAIFNCDNEYVKQLSKKLKLGK